MTATVGIDLASRLSGTAICAVEWDPSPRVVELIRGVVGEPHSTPPDDKLVLGVMCGHHGAVPADVTKLAIDAPFGWRAAFADSVSGAAPWLGADAGVACPPGTCGVRRPWTSRQARFEIVPVGVPAHQKSLLARARRG